MLDYDTAFVTQSAPSGQGLPASSASGIPMTVNDGTPINVAIIVLFSAGALWALRHWGGVKFSSTVSVS